MESDAFDIVGDARTEMQGTGESIRHDARSEMELDAFALVRDTRTEMREAGEKLVHENRSKLETEAHSVVTDARSEMRAERDAVVNDAREQIESVRDTLVGEYRDAVATESYEKQKSDLKADLVKFYRKKKCQAALSPLTSKYVEDLSKIFVTPRLCKMERYGPNAQRTPNSSGGPVIAFKDMFYSDQARRENIYIVGEAGMGKSMFCKYLTTVWCDLQRQTENNDVSSTKKPNKIETFTDFQTLREFELMFPLVLRGAAASDKKLRTLLDTQIFLPLEIQDKYDAVFINKVLRDEKCLFVIDGLDEWPHSIPEKAFLSNSSFVTTMRPWKMAEVTLNESDIDVELSIEGIENSNVLIENLLACLEKRPHLRACPERNLSADTFKDEVEICNLENLLQVPIVLEQLVCLWFESSVLGKSKCDVYARTLEMLLKRCMATKRLNVPEFRSPNNGRMPQCFNKRGTKYCLKYSKFIDDISALAFHTLLSEDQSCSIVFDEDIVQIYLTSDDRIMALETGILSQYETESLLEESSTFNFLHKTFQEFLCALYISTHHGTISTDCLEKVFRVFGQAVDILDIAEIFTFVCGMNSNLGVELSKKIAEIVDFSSIITNHDLTFYKANTYSRMILSGYTECERTGYHNAQLSLRHAVIGATFPPMSDVEIGYLKNLVSRNAKCLTTFIADDVSVGEIKDIVSQAKGLTHVQLYNILGDGVIDLTTCTRLVQLHASEVRVENFVIYEANLVNLGICKTVVKHEAFGEKEIPSLRKLDICIASNRYLPWNLGRSFPNLEFLRLSNGILPEELRWLPRSIQHIVLSNVYASDRAMKTLQDNLKDLPHSVLIESTHDGFEKYKHDAIVNMVRDNSVFKDITVRLNEYSYNRHYVSFRSVPQQKRKLQSDFAIPVHEVDLNSLRGVPSS